MHQIDLQEVLFPICCIKLNLSFYRQSVMVPIVFLHIKLLVFVENPPLYRTAVIHEIRFLRMAFSSTRCYTRTTVIVERKRQIDSDTPPNHSIFSCANKLITSSPDAHPPTLQHKFKVHSPVQHVLLSLNSTLPLLANAKFSHGIT